MRTERLPADWECRIPDRFSSSSSRSRSALVDVFHASVTIAAASTRRVAWDHVVYRIAAPHAIKVEERLPFPVS